MPRCTNCPDDMKGKHIVYYSGHEKSPQGRGFCPECDDMGKRRYGTDDCLYYVGLNNKRKKAWLKDPSTKKPRGADKCVKPKSKAAPKKRKAAPKPTPTPRKKTKKRKTTPRKKTKKRKVPPKRKVKKRKRTKGKKSLSDIRAAKPKTPKPKRPKGKKSLSQKRFEARFPAEIADVPPEAVLSQFFGPSHIPIPDPGPLDLSEIPSLVPLTPERTPERRTIAPPRPPPPEAFRSTPTPKSKFAERFPKKKKQKLSPVEKFMEFQKKTSPTSPLHPSPIYVPPGWEEHAASIEAKEKEEEEIEYAHEVEVLDPRERDEAALIARLNDTNIQDENKAESIAGFRITHETEGGSELEGWLDGHPRIRDLAFFMENAYNNLALDTEMSVEDKLKQYKEMVINLKKKYPHETKWDEDFFKYIFTGVKSNSAKEQIKKIAEHLHKKRWDAKRKETALKQEFAKYEQFYGSLPDDFKNDLLIVIRGDFEQQAQVRLIRIAEHEFDENNQPTEQQRTKIRNNILEHDRAFGQVSDDPIEQRIDAYVKYQKVSRVHNAIADYRKYYRKLPKDLKEELANITL